MLWMESFISLCRIVKYYATGHISLCFLYSDNTKTGLEAGLSCPLTWGGGAVGAGLEAEAVHKAGVGITVSAGHPGPTVGVRVVGRRVRVRSLITV